MRKIILLALLLLTANLIQAENLKWAKKAKEAQFSIITYDSEDHILNTGNGFFVSDDGIGLSDFGLFKNAHRAVVVLSDGKKLAVKTILGADELYDLVKFKVEPNKKGFSFLEIMEEGLEIGKKAYLLPYATSKNRLPIEGVVSKRDTIQGQYLYYTLKLAFSDKLISCPLLSNDGKVIGMAQRSHTNDTDVCYAMSANYANELSINALSLGNESLQAIKIKKALPKLEDEALVFLYLASNQLSKEQYGELLTDFIEAFPTSSEGYLKRAAYVMATQEDEARFKKAEQDIKEAIRVANESHDIYYNVAKQIYNYLLNNKLSEESNWTFEQAQKYIEAAIKQQEEPIYLQLLGDIFFAKQEYKEAYELYLQVNKTPLVSSHSFYSAAKAKEFVGDDPKQVVALLDSCIARCVQPILAEDAPYLLERANAKSSIKNFRGALADYDAYFFAVNGKVNDYFYYYREQAAVGAKQYERALNDIKKAIELAPDDLIYQAEQAVLFLKIGKNEEALKALNTLIEQEPSYAEGYRLKGVALLQLKRESEACEALTKAKELGDPLVEQLIKRHCK